jgi:BirA family biotin operon repressor/biotin-[acetyl-CoA-carboxylase] ligase
MIWEGQPVAHWQSAWRIPQLVIMEQTTSTNDVARALADQGAAAGTVIIADWQSAGRGRSGRTWEAEPRQSLLLSMLLRPRDALNSAHLLGTTPVRVGLAAVQALDDVGVPAQWKWPNDVMVSNRKLGGILCESVLGPGDACIVAGVGINVAQSVGDWTVEVRERAGSVHQTRKSVDRAQLAGALIARMLPLATEPLREFSVDEMPLLARYDALQGREVLVDDVPHGIAAGIAPDGALLLRDEAGMHVVRAGTVRLREEKA